MGSNDGEREKGTDFFISIYPLAFSQAETSYRVQKETAADDIPIWLKSLKVVVKKAEGVALGIPTATTSLTPY
jgi:hypothetical protein